MLESGWARRQSSQLCFLLQKADELMRHKVNIEKAECSRGCYVKFNVMGVEPVVKPRTAGASKNPLHIQSGGEKMYSHKLPRQLFITPFFKFISKATFLFELGKRPLFALQT